MTNVVNPIHVEDVFGVRTRYFSSPVFGKNGVPDMPWHVFTDLLKILSLDEDASTFLLRKLRGDWPEPLTIGSDSGVLVIAPNFMAEGLFEAIVRNKRFRPTDFLKIRGAYRRNLMIALNKMVPHLGPMERILFVMNSMDKKEVK
jgi:hypothetical protein